MPVQDLSLRKSFDSVLSFHATVSSCKKSEKVHALIFHKNENHILGQFWLKNFKKLLCESIFKLNATVISCKKQTFHALIFGDT